MRLAENYRALVTEVKNVCGWEWKAKWRKNILLACQISLVLNGKCLDHTAQSAVCHLLYNDGTPCSCLIGLGFRFFYSQSSLFFSKSVAWICM